MLIVQRAWLGRSPDIQYSARTIRASDVSGHHAAFFPCA